MKRFFNHPLFLSALTIGVVYGVFGYVISPPLPRSLLIQYMVIVTIAVLLVAIFDDRSASRFGALVAIAGGTAYLTYQQTKPAADCPSTELDEDTVDALYMKRCSQCHGEEERWHVANYVMTLRDDATPPARGETVIPDAKGPDAPPAPRLDSTELSAGGVWKDDRWQVVFRRPHLTNNALDLQIEQGRNIPIAFANWDGLAGKKRQPPQLHLLGVAEAGSRRRPVAPLRPARRSGAFGRAGFHGVVVAAEPENYRRSGP